MSAIVQPAVEVGLTETAERRAVLGAPGAAPWSEWVIVTRTEQ